MVARSTMAVVEGSKFTRRSFLQGAAVATAGSLAALSFGQVGASAAAVSPPALTRSTFAPYLNKSFQIASGAQSNTALLTSIQDLLPETTPGNQNRFSLIFESTGGGRLSQAVYAVSQAQLGAMNLLVVPVDRGVKSQSYQVVINRSS
jgi:hypothetical protein